MELYEEAVKQAPIEKEYLFQKKSKNIQGTYQPPSLQKDVRYRMKKTERPLVQGMREADVVQREIVPLNQEGPTCGMYAMAMAMADLVPSDKMVNVISKGGGRNKFYVEYQELIQKNVGETIAKRLKELAQQAGRSALGEAFNAEELAAAGQAYWASLGLANKINIQVANFNNPIEYMTILSKAKDKNCYVLLPYFSDNAQPSDNGGKTVLPKDMYHAHWSVIGRKKGEGPEGGELYIHEGQKRLTGSLDSSMREKLYSSNSALGKKMSWTDYFQNSFDNLMMQINKIKEDIHSKKELIDIADGEREKICIFFDDINNHINEVKSNLNIGPSGEGAVFQSLAISKINEINEINSTICNDIPLILEYKQGIVNVMMGIVNEIITFTSSKRNNDKITYKEEDNKVTEEVNLYHAAIVIELDTSASQLKSD